MGSLLLWQQSLHILKNIYLFIWLCQALVAACQVFIETCGLIRFGSQA